MSVPDGDPLVLVTGASGYVASSCIQYLQREGYRVRGTVRSIKNEAKVKPIKEIYPEARVPIELVETDLTKDDGWEDAVRGCTYILHTASPIPGAEMPADEDELIRPAVDGTLRVLKAAKAVGNVKRVVVTSSAAALTRFDKVVNEDDWMDPDAKPTRSAYYRSKLFAEKAAWEFVEKLPEGDKFELAVVNPGFVMGPPLTKTLGASIGYMKMILEGSIPGLPNVCMPYADVRDVAEAHYNAMLLPEAAGKRFLIATECLFAAPPVEYLKEEFAPQGYKIKTNTVPYFLIWVASLCSRQAKGIVDLINKELRIDNTRMKTVLGIKNPRPVKTMMVDMAYAMIEGGYVKKTDKYTGPPSGQKF